MAGAMENVKWLFPFVLVLLFAPFFLMWVRGMSWWFGEYCEDRARTL